MHRECIADPNPCAKTERRATLSCDRLAAYCPGSAGAPDTGAAGLNQSDQLLDNLAQPAEYPLPLCGVVAPVEVGGLFFWWV